MSRNLLGNSVPGYSGGKSKQIYSYVNTSRVITHIYFLSGFPMVTLPVLVRSGMTCTEILSMCTVLMGAGWQYPTTQQVTVSLSGLEVIQSETYITKRNWSWGYN